MISGDSGKLVYFESHLKYQITTSQITLTRKNKKTNWGVNVSNIIAKTSFPRNFTLEDNIDIVSWLGSGTTHKLYDGLELYLATVQSLDEKGIAKKMGLKERDQILEVNGKSVRGWQSEDLLAEFSGNLSVTVTVISIEDRTITDLFLMTNRENDLNFLWALRQLVKLSICNIDFSGTGLDLSAITTTLHELIVTNCSLKCVTQILGVGRLVSLKRLILTHNNLEHVDEKTMLKLKELTDLQLGYNNLKSFPTVVTRMEKLEELSLIHNQISVLPDEVVQMRSLEKLHLDNNVLTELPEYVTLQLPQLRALTLENNKIAPSAGQVGGSRKTRSKFYYKIGVTDASIAQT